MDRHDYLTLLRRALSTPHGLALEFQDFRKAERARGRLYRLRSRLRRDGDSSFESLSLVMQPSGDLLIVRRDKLPRHDMEDGLPMESRPIGRDELPVRFGFRNYRFSVSKPKK